MLYLAEVNGDSLQKEILASSTIILKEAKMNPNNQKSELCREQKKRVYKFRYTLTKYS